MHDQDQCCYCLELVKRVVHYVNFLCQSTVSVFCYHMHVFVFNSLPNNNILDWTKFKAFVDDKLNVAKIMTSVFDLVEDIVGKGENAGIFSFSHHVFKRLPSKGR